MKFFAASALPFFAGALAAPALETRQYDLSQLQSLDLPAGCDIIRKWPLFWSFLVLTSLFFLQNASSRPLPPSSRAYRP